MQEFELQAGVSKGVASKVWSLAFAAGVWLLSNLGLANENTAIGLPAIDYYSAETYKAHHQNWSIQKHTNGSLYVANNSGVLEFDGERWKHLTAPNLTFVYDVAITDSRIYLGSQNDLGYFQKNKIAQWQFYSLKDKLTPLVKTGLNIGQIYRVTSTPIGVFFIGPQYLYHFHQDELKRIRLNRASATYAMSWLDGQLFIGNSFGEIFAFDPPSYSLVEFSGGALLNKEVIMDFFVTQSGQKYVVALDGLYALSNDPINQQNSVRKFTTDVDDWIKDHSALTAIPLKSGNIAIGSRNAGVAIIDPSGKLLNFIDAKAGLQQPRATGLIEDDQAGLWITHDGGLSRVALEYGFYRFDNSPIFKDVETIEAFNGSVYAGSRTQGLFRLQKTEGGQSSVFAPVLDYASVWSLGKTEESLLVGHGNGLDIYEPQGNRLALAKSLTSVAPVYDIVQFDPVTFYISHDNGIARVKKIGREWVLANISLNTRIDHMVLDSNQLWLGGLYQQTIRIRGLDRWPNVSVTDFDGRHGIPLGPVDVIDVNGRALFVAEDGILSFNDENSIEISQKFELEPAFMQFRNENDIQYPYPALQLSDDTLLFAQNDELVVTTRSNTGMYSVSTNIMNDAEYGRVNQIQTDGDMIWVAADSGVYGFNRSADILNSQAPQLLFKELKTNLGNTMTPDVFEVTPSFGKTNQIVRVAEPFTSDTTSVEILMALSTLRNADSNLFRWKTDGRWSDWSQDGAVVLDRLPRGSHIVTLQGKNSNNVLTLPIDFRFTIENFWYETWSFRVITVVTVLLLLFATVRTFTYRRTQKLLAEKKHLQQLVDEKTSELQIADAMKTQFFCNITHETRTPLTLNIGNIEHVLNDNPDLDDKIQRPLTQALSNAKRLLLLVNQILDINRYAAYEDELKSQTYDMNAFVDSISTRFQPLAKQRGIDFELALTDAPVPVDFDAEKMERVLVNLLSNSFKFTHSKGRVTVGVAQVDQQAMVTVLDSGIGIPEDQLPHIFDRFYSNTKQQKLEYASSGIGLSIVKSIVELHGGSIQAENVAPKGCCFTILLPLSSQSIIEASSTESVYTNEIVDIYESREASKALLPIHSNSAEKINSELPDKKTILVIDDNEELRQFIVNVFGEDFLVFEAGDGQEGLALARQYFPDLVICDLMMPVMDGLEFTRVCKADEDLSSIPIFILTANGTEQIRMSGFEAGAIDFLEKPFQFKEFKTKVTNFLETQERLFNRIRASIGSEAPQSVVEEVKAEEDPFVAKVTSYIREHIYEEITVESLATQFNTDRSNLYRHIQKQTDMSTQNFIKDQRLIVASELLLQSSDNISTIAYKLGFNNLSYFTRSFKTKFSCTPNQFRALNKVSASSVKQA